MHGIASQEQLKPRVSSRLVIVDALKGVLIISCVLFHLCYDLNYLAGVSIPWFAGVLQDMWRFSVAWPFIFIAGMMCNYSRDNLFRGLRYLALAVLIFLVTSLVSVDAAISFGIIYCMGACTLLVWILERLDKAPVGRSASFVLLAIFLLCFRMHWGYVLFGPWKLYLPQALYRTPWLAWLGFPSSSFSSSDYWPLLPHIFLFLSGRSFGAVLRGDNPASMRSTSAGAQAIGTSSFTDMRKMSQFLELFAWLGRHVLPIYLLHQPILLTAIQLIRSI